MSSEAAAAWAARQRLPALRGACTFETNKQTMSAAS